MVLVWTPPANCTPNLMMSWGQAMNHRLLSSKMGVVTPQNSDPWAKHLGNRA